MVELLSIVAKEFHEIFDQTVDLDHNLIGNATLLLSEAGKASEAADEFLALVIEKVMDNE
jgi:hypothetical protein